MDGGLQIDARVGQHSGYGAGGGGGGASQDGAGALALTALEIAVGGRDGQLAGRDEISVHGDAHGAAGDAPFGAGGDEDLVQTFGLGVAAHGLGAGDDQHPHARLDLAAAQDIGGGAQVGQAAVGAAADE